MFYYIIGFFCWKEKAIHIRDVNVRCYLRGEDETTNALVYLTVVIFKCTKQMQEAFDP